MFTAMRNNCTYPEKSQQVLNSVFLKSVHSKDSPKIISNAACKMHFYHFSYTSEIPLVVQEGCKAVTDLPSLQASGHLSVILIWGLLT